MNEYQSPVMLLKEVDEFSSKQLKKREGLQILFEEIFKRNNEPLLEEIAFSAKYVEGLKRVLEEGRKNPEVKNLEQVKQDYTANVTKIFELLKEVISSADDATRQQFEAAYLQMTQESFLNFRSLLHDLDWTKRYLNHQKREKKN